MAPTQHKIILERDFQRFEEAINKATADIGMQENSNTPRVFATQTHVTSHQGELYFTAVLFYK